MKKYAKIYEKLSKIYFLIHAFAFALILIASFMPFCNGMNFYQFFKGYQGMPFVMLGLLLIAVLASFLAIKWPLFSVLVVPLSYSFFFLMILMPFTAAAFALTIENLTGANVDASLPLEFHAGFDVMSFVSRVTILETPFTIYAIVVAILKGRDKRAAKKATKH